MQDPKGKVFRLASVVGVLCCLALGPVRAQECVHYEPEVVHLDGTLILRVLPGPPHYRSFETGDQPESVWMFTPRAPLCIDGVPDDEVNTGQSQVKAVQIVPRTSFNMGLNGKAARVEGTLYRDRGGHAHASVLMRVTNVTSLSK
jgi:hypothetical protein